MIVQKFQQWIGIKNKLHNKHHPEPRVLEGEIWWASLGENVGYEINGKSKLFSRPVIIYKKLARGFYLVIPTSTQKRSGTWFISFVHRKMSTIACLHQIRTIDYRRLYSTLGRLDDQDFYRIKQGFKNLYM